jgi:hypothetical protein
MKRISLALVMALLGLQSLGVSAQSAEQPSLAIFQIDPRGAKLSDSELDGLSRYLGTKTGEVMPVRIVEWEFSYRYLRSKDLHMCMDRRCQIDVETKLKVDYSLHVSINIMGKTCIMNATLYPAGSPASLRTAIHKGKCGGDDFVNGIDDLVAKLVATGPLPVPVEAAVAVAPVKRPPLVQRPGPGSDKRPPPVSDPPPAADPAKTRNIDHFPRFQIAADLSYAPAPLVLHEVDGKVKSMKVPDHYGTVVSFDYRFASYLLVGGQMELLTSDSVTNLGATARFGGLLPLKKNLGLFGYLGVGFNTAEVRKGSLAGEYAGYHAWLGLGLRHRFNDLIGLEFQLAGFAGQERSDPRDLVIYRLHLQMGILFGFGS